MADLFVVLDSVTDPFSRGMKAAAADAEAQSHRMSSALGTVVKAGLGIGAAAVGVGVASVKMATDFQAKMTLLSTQAGVAKGQIGSLSDGVLSLAGQVGFAPNSLADALFHIESSFASTGITGSQALNLLKVAAEGAAVGHADLVDVTNALDSAVVSGIPGVQDLTQAMGVLNATVGAGDMQMQDLADAFSTGLLASVKGYGLTFRDVGAALAVFGDNNIRGQVAATDLRMAVQSLAVPAKTGGGELTKLGLASDTLAKDLQAGGLLQALQDLKKHMDAAGVSTKQQGQILTEVFGKKAGVGINILYDQLDRLQSKYPDMARGANGFSSAWEETKNTFSQQIREIGAGADALGIRLGQFLIPQLSKLVTMGQGDLGQIASGFTGAASVRVLPHGNQGNAFLNREVATPPPLTGWQEFGQRIHQVFTDIEHGARQLEPVGADFVRFGEDAWQALGKLVQAAEPVAQVFGGALLLGVEGVGKALAGVAGPAIKDFADFLDSHQGMIKFFAEVVLGGLITKMTILGGIKAAQGVIGLATSIAQFPLSQAGQIKTAFDGLKAAWAGKEAAQGEQAVQGLSGAFADLKAKASGVLDKILPDSGKLAGIAQMGQDFEQSGLKAKGAVDQLSLFETTEQGIIQVAPHEQLGPFEQDLSNVEMEAGNAATASEGLAGKIGKFALAGGLIGGAIFGLTQLGQWLGNIAHVGDHTAISLDQLQIQLQLAGSGSIQADQQFTKTAVGLASMQAAIDKASHGFMSFGADDSRLQGLKDMDTALSKLVTSGHADQAKAQFTDIANALAKQGIDAAQAASDFPQYSQAIKNAGDAAQTTDGQLSSMQATLNLQQGLTVFNSDLATMTDQLKAGGNSMDTSTQAGRQNQQMFETLANDVINYYQQQRSAGIDTNVATQIMAGQAQQIEKLGQQFGISKDVVDQFLGSLAGIKPLYNMTVTANIGPAEQALNGLVQQINNSTGTVQIYGSSVGPGTGGKALGGMADGGFVPGPKNAPVPMIVHGGEYVLSNAMQAGRQAVDPRLLSGVFAARPTGYVPGFGSGASTVVNYNITVQVGGVVGISVDQLVNVLRSEVLRDKNRNSHNLWG